MNFSVCLALLEGWLKSFAVVCKERLDCLKDILRILRELKENQRRKSPSDLKNGRGGGGELHHSNNGGKG